MGGYGTLIYALHHPDMFAAAVPFSAGIHTDNEIINMTEERYNKWYAPLYGENKKGKDRLTAHWYKNNVLACIKNMPEEDKDKVRFYIDCGDDDFLYEGNSELHILMRDLDIPHEYRVRDGAHNWTYWRTGIKDALRFIGDSFHR
jgi:S-formylglutathione hydrolase FrmB